MNFVLPQNCVLLALTARLLLQCEGCSDGWFGQNCRFQCHCFKSPKCKSDGSCLANDRCAIGYFGLSCQFADWAADYSMRSVPPFLRDSNDSTCNPNKGATSVKLSLTRYILLTWFRIVVNNNRSLLNFKTTLDTGTVCPNERKVMHSNNAVDVKCDLNTNTSVLKIEGIIAGDICSVYISGGRNVALKQHAWQSSTLVNDTDTYGSDNAVDGSVERNYTLKRCSHTAKQVDRPEYKIVFDKVYYVSYILIISNKIHSVTLNGSLIEGFDSLDERTFAHQETLFELPTTYLVQLTSQALVKKITIKQASDMPDYYRCMAICEFLVFGECEPKSYGIYCNMTCSPGCVETCNSETGMCTCKLGYTGDRCTECAHGFHGLNCSLKCPEFCVGGVCGRTTGLCVACVYNHDGLRCEGCAVGFHGDHCNMMCPKFCKARICYKDTGLCKECAYNHIGPLCKGCPPGLYGEYCSLPCSSGCLQNKCNGANGVCACKPGFRGARCTVCVVGFYGDHCNLTCSALCADRLCNRNTGFCVKCAHTSHKGPRCEDCPEMFFGPQCSTPCSSHCRDNKCYPTSGYCLACRDAYMGLECDMENLFSIHSSSPALSQRITATMLALWLALSILFE